MCDKNIPNEAFVTLANAFELFLFLNTVVQNKKNADPYK